MNGVHFTFAGRQVRSLLALLSYLGKGENVERHLGVRIPPSNLQPGSREQARAFANELADGLDRRASDAVRRDPSVPPQDLSPVPPIGAHTNSDR